MGLRFSEVTPVPSVDCFRKSELMKPSFDGREDWNPRETAFCYVARSNETTVESPKYNCRGVLIAIECFRSCFGLQVWSTQPHSRDRKQC